MKYKIINQTSLASSAEPIFMFISTLRGLGPLVVLSETSSTGLN